MVVSFPPESSLLTVRDVDCDGWGCRRDGGAQAPPRHPALRDIEMSGLCPCQTQHRATIHDQPTFAAWMPAGGTGQTGRSPSGPGAGNSGATSPGPPRWGWENCPWCPQGPCTNPAPGEATATQPSQVHHAC